jgi:hypothetical protein
MSGFSEESRAGKTSTDINSEQYSVIGYSPAEIQEFEKKYYNDNNPKAKAAADAVLDALREVQKSTIELNREGNYWSAPVERLVKFYGWQNYVPLKGTQKDVDSRDTFLDINRSPRLGGELQEAERAFGGRVTPSDNAILQSLVEATKAAMRAGRKDVTLAIKNAVEQKLLMGEVGEPVPFEDRYKLGKEAIKKNKTLVFHYNPDGSITPISLTDRVQREAIKRTYEESQPLINMLNWATSHLGMFHTRYNIAFGPMNFIRDALTNAFTIGAEMSPIAAGQYIGAVSRIVSTKMHKAAQVAILYENGKFDQIEAMAKKDPFVQDLYEYIQSGGKISYLQGLTTKAQQKELQADILSGSTSKATKAINRVFDYYMDTFEMASRAASYHVSKRQFMAELNEQRKPKTQAEKAAVVEEARVKATAYTKNLANFEQVGQWGKAAGAYFMFFRPAATGAIRAIDAIGPALRSVESAKKELPAVVLNDPEAVKRFEAKYKEQQKAARAMSVALMGFGAAVYYMAYALADDDDQGRNRVATDDPDRWSRYARLFIPGFENPIQLPWGFGLGAFAAAGAQIASIGDSNTIGGALKNIVFNIGMDAFLPLPVSRINPIEHPSMWLMDTALPSALRPLLEHTMNMNALGQQIYNNRQSRYGDAYTGGDKIPEAYKAAARTLYDITGGAVDWSPNSLYFFANNYADGPSRLLNGIVDIGLTAAGEKEFNPRTDTLAFTSFFGAPSNYDAKQFSDIQEKVLRIKQRLDTMEVNSPDKYAEYVGNNPEHYAAVKIYDKQINGMLREIQQQTNEVRRMPGLSIKERQQMIEDLVNVQNSIKAGLVQTFEAYGVKP